MPQRRIKTEYWAKPIPIRLFDWTATRDGWDLGEPVGYGATEQDAMDDLIAQEIDADEEAEQCQSW